jgi:hypothetical protein
MPNASLTRLVVERWLSKGRLDIYRAATQGDLDRALSLYEWNARATAACLHDIGHLEVLLRNRYDEQLRIGDPDWTALNAPLWRRLTGNKQTRLDQERANHQSRRNIDQARNRPGAATHGHVIANLTFGFWSALSQAERNATIWTPILSPIFPGRTRGSVHDALRKLSTFRNRLAHWVPLFSGTTGLMRQLERVDDVFTALDPRVAEWVGQRSDVLHLMQTLPEPLIAPPPAVYLGVPSCRARTP